METKKKKNNKEEDNKDTRRRIILIIITIIIIILLLITSCSCGSKFWGRIGNWFSNKGEYNIGEEENKERITNKDLKFDIDGLDITASDEKIKIPFSIKNINPKSFTCKTSDASIATCYVDEDGYVVLIPKKPGTVTVTVEGEANGKIYEATTEVTINETSRNIILESTSGTIDLSKNNTHKVKYTLKGISGEVKVESSDPSVATATVGNGILTITGKNPGKSTITLSVEYNNRVYTATYTITVEDNGSGKPNIPNTDSESNNLLMNITTNRGKLTPSFKYNIKKYTINLKESDKNITLTATPSSNKAKVTYTYNGKTTNSFKDIAMNAGVNEVIINVIAGNGSVNKYTVIINKPTNPTEPDNNKSDDATLKNIISTPSGIYPSFNKDTKDYKLDLNESQDSVTLVGIPSSSKSKVTYTYDGKTTDSFNSINIASGSHKVTITVTAEDGTTKDYTVTINKPDSGKDPGNDKDNDATLQNLIAKPRNLNPIFNKGTHDYTVDLKADDPTITLEAIASSKNSKVEFIFNGNTTSSFDNIPIDVGTHTVTVLVTAQDGSTEKYTVNITKKSNDTSIGEVIVNGSVITPVNGEYKTTIGSNEQATINVTPHDSNANVKYYTYTDKDGNEQKVNANEFKNIDLPAGDNTVYVTIEAQDGTINTYPIEIYKEHEYKINIDSNDKNFTCYLESKECVIRYNITKDGGSYTEYDPNSIIVDLPKEYQNKITIDKSKAGEVILKINDTTDLLNEKLEVNLKYQNSSDTSNITFTSNNYTLSVNPKEIYTVLNDEKVFALYNDMFIKENAGQNGFKVIKDLSGKKIRIESNNDKNIFIEISTTSDLINLDTDATADDFNSLPIKILTGNTEGKAYITVTGSAFGKNITNTTLEVNIVNKYLLTLEANGGIFIGTTDIYQYKISATDTLYLNIDEYNEALKKDPSLTIGVPAIPYKVDDDCFKIHEFRGYALKNSDPTYIYEEKDILFTNDKNNVSDIYKDKVKTTISYTDLESIGTNEVVLVAVYKEDTINRDFTEEKEMWLVDVPLFHNEEYYQKYKEDKVIYPGAKGEYTMYFKNTTKDPIKFTSLTLKEENICFDDGCLNMGYIVKDSNNNYIYGASDEYWLLNGRSKYSKKDLVTPDGTSGYRLDKPLNDELVLTPNTDKDWAEITIHWRWIEFDRESDILDTKVGNYAANNKLNTYYRLSVGLKYQVLATTCEESKKN